MRARACIGCAVQAPPVEQLMCNHMVMLREFVSQLPPEQACAGAQRVAEAERDLHADMAAAPAGRACKKGGWGGWSEGELVADSACCRQAPKQ